MTCPAAGTVHLWDEPTSGSSIYEPPAVGDGSHDCHSAPGRAAVSPSHTANSGRQNSTVLSTETPHLRPVPFHPLWAQALHAQMPSDAPAGGRASGTRTEGGNPPGCRGFRLTSVPLLLCTRTPRGKCHLRLPSRHRMPHVAASGGRARRRSGCGTGSPGPVCCATLHLLPAGMQGGSQDPLLPPGAPAGKPQGSGSQEAGSLTGEAGQSEAPSQLAAIPEPGPAPGSLVRPQPDSAGANTSGSHKPAGGCLALSRPDSPRGPQAGLMQPPQLQGVQSPRVPGPGGGRKLRGSRGPSGCGPECPLQLPSLLTLFVSVSASPSDCELLQGTAGPRLVHPSVSPQRQPAWALSQRRCQATVCEMSE